MEFEFDLQKSEANKLKHGISLIEARQLWDVPAIELRAKTIDEPRFMLIGKINGKLYSCIYTLRDEKIRLISARRSREKEEKIYHERIEKEENT